MLEKYIKAALKETECDVLLKNGKYVNLFDGEVEEGDIAIKDDRIVGIGKGYNVIGKAFRVFARTLAVVGLPFFFGV